MSALTMACCTPSTPASSITRDQVVSGLRFANRSAASCGPTCLQPGLGHICDWLTDPLYRHAFYVDGTPQSFRCERFADDADHPGGWGTILVVGFRMGGGDITVNGDTDQDLGDR